MRILTTVDLINMINVSSYMRLVELMLNPISNNEMFAEITNFPPFQQMQ